MLASASSASELRCTSCATPLARSLWCAACGRAVYCSAACQRVDWKRGGHRLACVRADSGGGAGAGGDAADSAAAARRARARLLPSPAVAASALVRGLPRALARPVDVALVDAALAVYDAAVAAREAAPREPWPSGAPSGEPLRPSLAAAAAAAGVPSAAALDAVAAALAAGGDPCAAVALDAGRPEAPTALFLAAAAGSLPLLRVLLRLPAEGATKTDGAAEPVGGAAVGGSRVGVNVGSGHEVSTRVPSPATAARRSPPLLRLDALCLTTGDLCLSPLAAAAEAGAADAVEILLSAGAPPAAPWGCRVAPPRGAGGDSPAGSDGALAFSAAASLHLAGPRAAPAVLRALVQGGLDVNAPAWSTGEGLLHALVAHAPAAAAGEPEGAAAILPLFEAALELGAAPAARAPSSSAALPLPPGEGETPLGAIARVHAEAVTPWRWGGEELARARAERLLGELLVALLRGNAHLACAADGAAALEAAAGAGWLDGVRGMLDAAARHAGARGARGDAEGDVGLAVGHAAGTRGALALPRGALDRALFAALAHGRGELDAARGAEPEGGGAGWARLPPPVADGLIDPALRAPGVLAAILRGGRRPLVAALVAAGADPAARAPGGGSDAGTGERPPTAAAYAAQLAAAARDMARAGARARAEGEELDDEDVAAAARAAGELDAIAADLRAVLAARSSAAPS